MLELFTQSAISRWLGRIALYRRIVLAVAILVTAAGTSVARGLELESNLIELLPDTSASVRTLHRALEEVGGTGDLMVMIESPDPGAQLRYARSILPEVRRLPWVERASLGNSERFLESHKLLYADLGDLVAARDQLAARLEYERLARNPLYVDLEDRPPPPLELSDLEDKYREAAGRALFRSDDGAILILVIRPRGVTGDLERARASYRQLQELVDRHAASAALMGVRVSVGGTVRNRIVEYDTIAGDVRTSAVLVAAMLFLLLAWYFRGVTAVGVLFVPLAMSLVWTFALTELLIGSLNIITVFLLVVLMGLGIDFGIHVLARYQRERLAGRGAFVAMVATIATAGRASLTASLTTAACFFALSLAEFRGLSEFGLIAGIGMLATSLAYLVVMPALLSFSWIDRRVIATRRRPRKLRHRRPWGWPLIAACTAVGLAGAALATGVQFEYDLREIRARSPSTRAFNRKMRQVFPDARDPAVVVVEGRERAATIRHQLERRRATSGGDDSPIAKVLSLDSLIPADLDAKVEVIAELGELSARVPPPDDRGEADALARLQRLCRAPPIRSAADLPDDLRRRFAGASDPSVALVFVFQRRSLMDLREAVAFADALSNIRVAGREYRPASEALVLAEVFRDMRRDLPRTLALALFALVLLLLVDVGSLAIVGLMLVPLVWGLAIAGGLMALAGIKLNLLNGVVLASVIGLGVDGGVHMVHAARSQPPRKRSAALRHSAGAVTICTATSMISFGSMLTASHPGLQSIGSLSVVSLATCLVGAVVVLPGLLISGRRGNR